MAESNDAMFSMDVGDVLARLHVSSILKLRTQSYYTSHQIVALFNTGVVGMVRNPMLTMVKNNGIQFDLTSKNKLYEVGVVIHEFKAKSDSEYVNNFIDARKIARKAMHDYFAAFAGDFKAKNIEEQELHGFLLEERVMPWTVDTYNEYQYKIPMKSELPPTFQQNGGDIDWTDILCFKVQYKLDSGTM